MRSRPAFIAMVAAATLTTAGCLGTPAAKAGQQTVTLHFATTEAAINSQGHMKILWELVNDIATASGGRMKITLDTEVGSGSSTAEPDLIKAIEKGDYDGGWSPTRSFPAADSTAFDALQAPFAIQSYAVEQQVVTSDLAERMLGRLSGTGLVGLGLVAGPLRRPFAVADPLVEPGDWRGVSFRVENSPVQLQTVTALGAKPYVTGSAGIGPSLGVAGGQEFDIIQYDFDGFANADPYVTDNLTLWPRTVALVMNAHRFAELSDQQKAWIRDAVRRVVTRSATASFDETPATQRLCLTGVRFAEVTPAQLDALRTAVAPVYDQLRRDPVSAADLALIQSMDAAHPRPSAPTVPAGCRGPAPRSATVDTTIKTAPNVPDGAYRVHVSAPDFEAFGAEAVHATDNAGNATLTLRGGEYVLRIRFDGDTTETLVEAGTVHGTKDTILFVPSAKLMQQLGACASDCPPVTAPYDLGYRYADGTLTMTVGAGLTDPISLGTMASEPWLKID